MDTNLPAPSNLPQPTAAERVWLEFRVMLASLPPSARAAFLLHDVFGAPVEEVSSALDLPVAACVELIALARTCAHEHARDPGPSGTTS